MKSAVSSKWLRCDSLRPRVLVALLLPASGQEKEKVHERTSNAKPRLRIAAFQDAATTSDTSLGRR